MEEEHSAIDKRCRTEGEGNREVQEGRREWVQGKEHKTGIPVGDASLQDKSQERNGQG